MSIANPSTPTAPAGAALARLEGDSGTLPPTLQPGAIFRMAPPPERGLSVLVTGGIYGLLLLLLNLWMVRAGLDRRLPVPRLTVPLTLEDASELPVPTLALPLTGVARADGPEGAGPLDPRHLALDPVLPMEARSEAVPELPRPLEHPAPPAGEVSPRGSGGTGLALGSGHGEPLGVGSGRAMIRGVPGLNPGLDLRDLEILHEEIPRYPVMAEFAHIQGDVVVRVTIDDKGAPIRTELLEGPPSLQAETMRAVKLWRFGRGIFRGKALKATFDMTFRYILR